MIPRRVIFVAGLPASGKTSLATQLANEFHLPLFTKDDIKERIWERVQYDTNNREVAAIYSALAYEVSFYFLEELMRVGVSYIYESNFTPKAAEVLARLVAEYRYRAVTVLCEAEDEILYERFTTRDGEEGRHPGLVAQRRYRDLAHFKRDTEAMRQFSVGDYRIVVDTTDFTTVNYTAIIEQLRGRLEGK